MSFLLWQNCTIFFLARILFSGFKCVLSKLIWTVVNRNIKKPRVAFSVSCKKFPEAQIFRFLFVQIPVRVLKENVPPLVCSEFVPDDFSFLDQFRLVLRVVFFQTMLKAFTIPSQKFYCCVINNHTKQMLTNGKYQIPWSSMVSYKVMLQVFPLGLCAVWSSFWSSQAKISLIVAREADQNADWKFCSKCICACREMAFFLSWLSFPSFAV